MGPLVAALGVAQIISWGTLFYAIGVLGPAMRGDLGVSELFLFTSFTVGLLVSSVLSPLAGRLIDDRGGRLVLSAGSILAAIALTLLACAKGPVLLMAGWLVAGAAMAACLYDPAFATLGQHTGERYRKAVTALTLFGGFASTVFWPLSLLLLEAWGWRATLGIYAGIHLFVCLPIHRHFVPAYLAPAPRAVPVESATDRAAGDSRFIWLTLSFAVATFIFAVMAVHLITLLTSAGLTPAQAVSVSMLVGPLQVAGRVIEFRFSARVRAVTVGVVSFALMLLSLVALISVEGFGIAAVVFIVAYGIGNGVLTIVRGTAPVELYGREGLGRLLGKLGAASQFAKAVAPAAFSGLLALGLTRNAALGALVAVGFAGLGSFWVSTRARR